MKKVNLAKMYAYVFTQIETIDDVGKAKTPYLNVSVFDHWLNEKEADDCDILAYKIAVNRGRENAYLSGEQQFLQLYRKLGEGGIVINVPGPLREIYNNCSEVDEIFKNSLREKKLMDVFFPIYSVRVLGGYDRTDLFVLHDWKKYTQLINIVEEVGLYAI
ncbi:MULTISPECIES: hypothetical protein [unclassified Sinorhizobium]|uniref:hypothetical protein n=1 Tax=unclassified Sinorhizobium TaxID=2613772 RepID=UPI00352371BB